MHKKELSKRAASGALQILFLTKLFKLSISPKLCSADACNETRSFQESKHNHVACVKAPDTIGTCHNLVKVIKARAM